MLQPENTKPTQIVHDERWRATIAVIALFTLACLDRLFAPEVALFRELLPIAVALLGLEIRTYLDRAAS